MKRSIISTVVLLFGIALLTSCQQKSTGPRQDPNTPVTPTPSK